MLLLRRRAFAGGVGAAAVLGAVPAWAKEDPPIPTLPLLVSVAEEGGKPVRDEAWVDAQVAEAERIFLPAGVHFRKAGQRALEARFARLETRKDRDALDAVRVKGRVNVFVVASLRDVDDPTLFRMGVHWRNGATPSHRYVIVTADALKTTLAHELGHYNGLSHTAVRDNLMSYDRSGERVTLSEPQLRSVRIFARLAFASGELTADPAKV